MGRAAAIDHRLFPGTFRFKLPYIDEQEFIAKLTPYREYITTVYLPLPPSLLGSGRPWMQGDPLDYASRLPGIIHRLAQAGLAPEIIANSPLPEWSKLSELLAFLETLQAHGLRHVTVAFLPLAIEVSKALPDLEISASTVGFIHDATRLERWIAEAKISGLVVDRSQNKRLARLQRLKQTGLAIGVVVDDGCLPSCPMQFQHYLILSEHEPGRGIRRAQENDAIEQYCGKWKRENSWLLYQSDVMPADFHRFAGTVDYWKFGRGKASGVDDLIEKLRYHMDTRHRVSFYLGYHEPEEVFAMLQRCDHLCTRCGWCSDTFAHHNEPTECEEGRHGESLWRPRTTRQDS